MSTDNILCRKVATSHLAYSTTPMVSERETGTPRVCEHVPYSVAKNAPIIQLKIVS